MFEDIDEALREFGLHESFVDIGYEELYIIITGMLRQAPYAGESYVSGSLRARGIFVAYFRYTVVLV